MKTSTASVAHNEDEYEVFLASIQANFTDNIQVHLFTTDATNLFETFLNNLPSEVRQHYTCHACQRFVDTFGGVVSISSDGNTIPIMWPIEVPTLYQKSVNAIRRLVSKAKVTGVFLSKDKVWGLPITGEWHHMAVKSPNVFRHSLLTPFQVMAEKKEDYKTLIAGLIEFPLSAVEQAITLLKTDSLYRSEKCLGVATWLADLHKARNATRNSTIKANLTWLAVASAPAGFCHIKSSMIGTLLEDIVSGLPFEVVSRKFSDKMHPLQYQRPQALPTEGNRTQAEKIIAQLKAAGSLERRFARLEEIQTIWQPVQSRVEVPAGEGVFSHLKTKGQRVEVSQMRVPSQTMTWAKFSQLVLPNAHKIEFNVPHGRSHFAALLTAVNQDAPPILQWDCEDNRNPISWYVYHGGSTPEQWYLLPGYCKVTGLCYKPSMWNGSFAHQGEGLILLLEGAKDTRYQTGGLGLFPEILKSEFHSIRSTIEAYSRHGIVEGYEDATANGLMLQKGQDWNVHLRVDGLEYRLDRWD